MGAELPNPGREKSPGLSRVMHRSDVSACQPPLVSYLFTFTHYIQKKGWCQPCKKLEIRLYD